MSTDLTATSGQVGPSDSVLLVPTTLYLIGRSNVGKSTAARALSASNDISHVDLDALVADQNGGRLQLRLLRTGTSSSRCFSRWKPKTQIPAPSLTLAQGLKTEIGHSAIPNSRIGCERGVTGLSGSKEITIRSICAAQLIKTIRNVSMSWSTAQNDKLYFKQRDRSFHSRIRIPTSLQICFVRRFWTFRLSDACRPFFVTEFSPCSGGSSSTMVHGAPTWTTSQMLSVGLSKRGGVLGPRGATGRSHQDLPFGFRGL